MRKRLAPGLVITISTAALGACNTTSPKPTVATADPTPAATDAAPPPIASTTSTTPRKRTPHDPPKPGRDGQITGESTEMNAKDPENGTIYISYDGDSCFVKLPFPPGTKLTSWQPSPTKTVDCPPSMDDATWDACRTGSISKSKDTGTCVCFHDGNPPPPPAEVVCPK